MSQHLKRSPRQRFVLAPLMLMAVLLAACNGTPSSSLPYGVPPTPHPSPTTSMPTPAPNKGPATASFAFLGDASLTGATPTLQPRCNQPSLDGSIITVYGQTSAPDVFFVVTLAADSIQVRLYIGSGTEYIARDFTGSGVTGFDAGQGARINSTLTENPLTGTKPGAIGTLLSLRGEVDCGDLTVGLNTITLSGGSAEGAIVGSLNPFLVECEHNAQYGNSVVIMGLINIGDAPTWMLIGLRETKSTLFSQAKKDAAAFTTHSYVVDADISDPQITFVADSVQVDASFSEAGLPSGSAPYVIHLTGQATCGSTVVS